ncbi:hypothetical protein IA938_04595 [Listeria welshimeri]|uniref:hypothetical protein n=1 Tax=Listeria welshimeri TaxID=1643 RepID=UPI001624DE20|nr:hypothetical protein [Listeria welshimeri]MBC1445495.1 hypothetical protein [Listeria welshimeri]MBF2508517.1 hypothetical protein [Listeria welshimeri]MBF2560205.1 hypothetical protein [Listeria welshimeri]MBF2565930.1 hypothetical protein [Listeria welshimeri]MBF2579317.1 hypothetical protein [Listeria welshimeri]
MYRIGEYGVYNNNEYKITKSMNGETRILTKDKSLTDDGFIDRNNSGVYSKVVQPEELSDVYQVVTKANYRNGVVQIIGENDNQYCIAVLDSRIAKELDIPRTDKYGYTKWVKKDELEVFEEKKMLTTDRKKSKGLDR